MLSLREGHASQLNHKISCGVTGPAKKNIFEVQPIPVQAVGILEEEGERRAIVMLL